MSMHRNPPISLTLLNTGSMRRYMPSTVPGMSTGLDWE